MTATADAIFLWVNAVHPQSLNKCSNWLQYYTQTKGFIKTNYFGSTTADKTTQKFGPIY